MIGQGVVKVEITSLEKPKIVVIRVFYRDCKNWNFYWIDSRKIQLIIQCKLQCLSLVIAYDFKLIDEGLRWLLVRFTKDYCFFDRTKWKYEKMIFFIFIQHHKKNSKNGTYKTRCKKLEFSIGGLLATHRETDSKRARSIF